MNGQAIVDLAESLTGRTTESAKMLIRANVIYRMIYARHEFEFSVRTGNTSLTARTANLSLGFTSGSGAVTGEAAFQAADSRVGGWIDVPGNKQRFYVYTSDGTNITLRPNATSSATETCKWFKTDFPLGISGAGASSFGRLLEVWNEYSASLLEIISPAEYQRRYGTVDIDDVGEPTVCAPVFIEYYNGSSVLRTQGVRVHPIPDDSYFLGFRYNEIPTDITLTSSPELGDARFDDMLAWGAAWLTRLDDVDSTAGMFEAQYERRFRDLVWAYGISPNASGITLGPRQGDGLGQTSGFKPW